MTESNPDLAHMPLSDFADALASQQPVPGGGAAAAVVAALASSLTAMVARLSLDRPRYAMHGPLHEEVIAASDAARLRLLELAEADASAYAAYRAAREMPHADTSEEAVREAATRAAARRATDVPLETVQACHAQVQLVDRCVGRTNPHAVSDLEVAALLLESAARGAALNVRANLPAIGDEGFAAAVSVELDQRLQQVRAIADRARERIEAGGTREPEGA